MSPRSAVQLRLAAKQFEAFAGTLQVSDVTDEVETAWLQHLLASGLSPATVNSRRRELNTLRLWAYRKHYTDEPPRDVPRAREPVRVPQAWTVDEVASLLKAASTTQGMIGNLKASAWWTAIISLVYWTGARIGDVLAARPASFDPARGEWTCTASKTGREHVYRLHSECVKVLDAIHNPAGVFLFPWPFSPNHIWVAFRSIVKRAAIRYDGGRRQLFYRLRRTNLSYCWAADPALAQRQADHSSARVTREHYVDPTIAAGRSAADVLPVPDVSLDRQLRLF